MIEAERLCKVFQDKKRGQVRAVSEVSFTCKPGQIYGLLGANGAGKTTTLRMLATILEPTDGTARVAGFDLLKDPQGVRSECRFSLYIHRALRAIVCIRDGPIFCAIVWA